MKLALRTRRIKSSPVAFIAAAYAIWIHAVLSRAAEVGVEGTSREQWVRPSGDARGSPRWGHADGLQVGLSPLPGPRGLLRVYAPYLKLPEDHVINYIAIEPTRSGEERRGLSELEFSKLDRRPGKRFWSSDAAPGPNGSSVAAASPSADAPPPARGVVETHSSVERLVVYINVEPFENGAHVFLRLTFRVDRPREVGVATFAFENSAPLASCISTATMGNYARIRVLRLADKVVTAAELWPHYQGDGFTPHARFPLSRLERMPSGEAVFTAEPEEREPGNAEYTSSVRSGWRYRGKLARQSWRVEQPDAALEGLVNGRVVYWNSTAPIPGGIAFENFELVTKFKSGQEFWFAVEPMEPDALSP